MAEVEPASDEEIAGIEKLPVHVKLVFSSILARLRVEQARAERAERERDEAREALAPFAEAANCFDNYSAKMDPSNWLAYGGTTSANGSVGAITVADLRRARATQGGENG